MAADCRYNQGMTDTAVAFHFEVFDGRGIATVWTVTRRKRGADLLGEYVGTVYGVHDEREARAAFAVDREADPEIRARLAGIAARAAA